MIFYMHFLKSIHFLPFNLNYEILANRLIFNTVRRFDKSIHSDGEPVLYAFIKLI